MRSSNPFRFKKNQSPTLQNWKSGNKKLRQAFKANSVIECGWGRLLFGQTFGNHKDLVTALTSELEGTRDIAFYIHDPHVVLSQAPSRLFLDPSHTYRIWFEHYRPSKRVHRNFGIRRILSKKDIESINGILKSRNMVPIDGDFLWSKRRSKDVFPLVSEDMKSGRINGFVMGVDHRRTIKDPENGSSLWSLAVDAKTNSSGVGEALTRYLIEYFQMQGRSFMDLSVLHENEQAIRLYEKLKFSRVPIFAVKMKNAFNEPLYSELLDENLNPYAQIIVNEALRRSLIVEIIDAENGCFAISNGTRRVRCRESLTDYTSAFSYTLCSNKKLTQRILGQNDVKVPAQTSQLDQSSLQAFLRQHQKVVVKPANGEQGEGVILDIQSFDQLQKEIKRLKPKYKDLIVEQMVGGEDVRIIVIDYRFVAAAVRRPPRVIGDGDDTVRTLVKKLSRRRAAATGGESQIPMDDELKKCLARQGYELDDVLPRGVDLLVRPVANVHQGGTIEDVTEQIHSDIRAAAERAARALEVPVVGFDFMMNRLDGIQYYCIEANERPGLANHEPQPVVEKFFDFLFPETRKDMTRKDMMDGAAQH